MKFSFDEVEIMNSYLEQQPVQDKEDFINILRNTIEHTDDVELIEICNNIIIKLRDLDEEKYTKLILELPIDTISVY